MNALYHWQVHKQPFTSLPPVQKKQITFCLRQNIDRTTLSNQTKILSLSQNYTFYISYINFLPNKMAIYSQFSSVGGLGTVRTSGQTHYSNYMDQSSMLLWYLDCDVLWLQYSRFVNDKIFFNNRMATKMEWRFAVNNLTSYRQEQVDARDSWAKSTGTISVEYTPGFFPSKDFQDKGSCETAWDNCNIEKKANRRDAFMHTESNLLHQRMILLLSSTYPVILRPMLRKQWKNR